jgi:hypothetical protein
VRSSKCPIGKEFYYSVHVEKDTQKSGFFEFFTINLTGSVIGMAELANAVEGPAEIVI